MVQSSQLDSVMGRIRGTTLMVDDSAESVQ
jgi:hypothetical protein